MRISNIQHYLGGADQVVAEEVLEGNQFVKTITTSSGVDFDDVGTTYEIVTELFTADVTNKRGSITINSLTKEPTATNQTYTKADVIRNAGTDTFELMVPSTLLSDFGSYTASPDSTSPYIVAMKLQWTSGEDIKSIRFLFVIRYQPQI